MKKIILFILLLSFVFIKPNINVLADSSSPTITWYEAIITNPNGAKTYDNYFHQNQLDLVIPYESEVIVLQEHSMYNILYNNKEYWVPAEDIAIKNQEFSLENASKLDEPVKALTMAERYVYSGPSSKFKKIGTIPRDTEISYKYVTKKNNSSSADWVYVEHDNIKGWILAVGGGGINELAYKTNITIKLLEKYENTYSKLSIPKDTVLNSFYVYNSGKSPAEYQVEYNGKKVWISDTSWPSIFEITENNDNTTNPETPNEDVNDNNQDVDLPNNENNKLDFYTILYLSIGATVLVSITALVTIILMNKKFNKNNNINKENVINNSEQKTETNLNDTKNN